VSNLWQRLTPWLPDGDKPDDGDGAVRALNDIATARHQLDLAELAAVQVARRHGKPWSEIATMLGITRQSAWERWRDIDSDAANSELRSARTPLGAVERAAGAAAGELSARARRSRNVKVPDLVGLNASDALGILTRAGLDAVSETPSIGLLEDPGELAPAIVVRQYPDPGAAVPPASTVKLWLERGDGSAGVREPRRPIPPIRLEHEARRFGS